MVVKSERGRRRYIFFEVPEQTRREDLAGTLSGFADSKVITCHGGEAVVRCSPADREALTDAVVTGHPGSRPVMTSGTLRTLRDRYPSLRVPRKRKR